MKLIDADALKLDIACVYGSNPKYLNWLNNAPTVDAVPVRHGKWKAYPITGDSLQCSVCGVLRIGEPSNYCPNCGADMREVDE